MSRQCPNRPLKTGVVATVRDFVPDDAAGAGAVVSVDRTTDSMFASAAAPRSEFCRLGAGGVSSIGQSRAQVRAASEIG